MGIRCHCPNGHRLNLKAFLAGRRGICPYCGVSFQIPSESARPGPKGATPVSQPAPPGPGTPPAAAPGTPLSGAAHGPAAVAPAPIAPVAQGPNPTILPTIPASPSLPVADPIPQVPSTPSAAAPTVAFDGTPGDMVELEPVAAPSVRDPLAEAPNAVWYVRPASGGQFGPATGEIMRTWIKEGRIGPDSLVWREGWRDWQQAGATFPQLNPNGPSLEGLIPGGSAASLPAARRSYSLGRRRSRGANLGLLIVLLVAVLLLLIVLFLVLRYQSGG